VANIDEMVDLTNIGTLFAFILVCTGIIVLRVKDPGRVRPFRVPSGWAWSMFLYACFAAGVANSGSSSHSGWPIARASSGQSRAGLVVVRMNERPSAVV